MSSLSPKAKMIRDRLVKTDISAYQSDINEVSSALKRENLREATLRNYSSYLTIFAAWLVLYCNGVSFLAVDIKTVKSFVDFLKDEQELSPNTINGYLAAIRKMFNALRDEELSKRVIPDLEVGTYLAKVPSVREVTRMLQACRNTLELLLIGILCSTGIRFNELLHMRFRDIRKDTHQIHIPDSKGRSDGYVPLRPKIEELLRKYCTEYNTANPNHKLTADDYVFFNHNHSDHLPSGKLRSIYMDIQVRAGLEEEHYTPHRLRHYFALNIYLQSKDLVLVRTLLRQKTLAATLKYLVYGASIHVQEMFNNPGDQAFEGLHS